MGKPQKKNITIQDIAESVRISASTVSRALNNHPKISQKTKEKVWKVAKKLGYLPNIPVYMQKQKNNIVVFFVDDLSKSSNHDFIEAAQESLMENGFQPLIKFMGDNKLDEKFVNLFKDIDVVGAISLLSNNQPIAETNYQLPLVSINKFNSWIPQLQVLPDIFNGAYLSANHLLNQGAKKIILIVGDSENLHYNDMKAGFTAAFSSNSKSSFRIIQSNLNKEVLKTVFEQIIDEEIQFDGIVTCDNFVACQLVAFLNSKNVKVPNNIMLVTFGNESFINVISPGISTIEYSSENMGTIAAEQLAQIINNNLSENKLLIEPAKLIIRASSLRILKD